jgi:hypothetical protein
VDDEAIMIGGKPSLSVTGNGDKTKRKQLSDEEIFAKLRLIVSHGDPHRKYKSKDKIGQG